MSPLIYAATSYLHMSSILYTRNNLLLNEQRENLDTNFGFFLLIELISTTLTNTSQISNTFSKLPHLFYWQVWQKPST